MEKIILGLMVLGGSFFVAKKLLKGKLNGKQTIRVGEKDIIFKDGNVIEFYDNGNVKRGYIVSFIHRFCYIAI